MFTNLSDVKRWIEQSLYHEKVNILEHLSPVLKPFKEPNLVKTVFKSILRDPAELEKIADSSYSHINGFDKIVLLSSERPAYKLRLHIWWPLPEDIAKEVEGFRIHDHRWDFSSIILAGSFSFQLFQLAQKSDTSTIELYRYQYFSPEGKNHYQMTYQDQARVSSSFDGYLPGGSTYTLANTALHRVSSDHTQLTATIILQGPVVKQSTTVLSNEQITATRDIPVRKLQITEIRKSIEQVVNI